QKRSLLDSSFILHPFSMVLRPASALQVLEADRLEYHAVEPLSIRLSGALARRRDDDSLAARELAGLFRRTHRRRAAHMALHCVAAKRSAVNQRHHFDPEAVAELGLLVGVEVLAVHRDVERAEAEPAGLVAGSHVLNAGAEDLAKCDDACPRPDGDVGQQ